MPRIKTEHTLVISTNRGRFALDDGQYGEDISSGCPLDIWLGGQWVAGRVEHKIQCYPGQMMVALFQPAEGPEVVAGYYFISDDGGICGLCLGMKVRL